ncbi:MAG: hypothetical protein RBS57_07820, partial [Desulforhabdus sp.]|nr:hypothetical protein [Desulforhabdus sp.]
MITIKVASTLSMIHCCKLGNLLFRFMHGFFLPLFLFLSLLFAGAAAGAGENSDVTAPNNQLEILLDSLTSTIVSERDENAQLKGRLEQMQQSAKILETQINVYKFQISTFSNLLHQNATSTEELTKARADLQSTLQDTAAQAKNLDAGQT